MDIWKVLGILPTRDKNAIKAAYHEQLTQVHPEEKARGVQGAARRL